MPSGSRERGFFWLCGSCPHCFSSIGNAFSLPLLSRGNHASLRGSSKNAPENMLRGGRCDQLGGVLHYYFHNSTFCAKIKALWRSEASHRVKTLTKVNSSRRLLFESPDPGFEEKCSSNLFGTPSHFFASGGGSFLAVMFGQVLANSALTLSHFSEPGSVSGLIASTGHSGSQTPQSMHSSGWITSIFSPSYKQYIMQGKADRIVVDAEDALVAALKFRDIAWLESRYSSLAQW